MIRYDFSPPGSFKTYNIVVNEVIPALKSGRHVYTNIDGLDLREISLITGVPVAHFNYHKITTKTEIERLFAANHDDPQCLTLQAERGSLLVVDEAETMWLNRAWESTAQSFIYFLKYHRHVDCDVVFMGTYLESFDKALRNVGGLYYSYMNYKFLGIPLGTGKYRVKMRLDADAQPLITTTYTAEEKYFRTYRSALQVNQQLSKQFPIPKQFYIVVGCFIFCAWAFLGVRKVSVWGWNKPPIVKSSTTVAAVPPPSPYGNFVEQMQAQEKNKNENRTKTTEGVPQVSEASLLPVAISQQSAKTAVCSRKKVGGCFEMGGQKDCEWEFKEVCE